MNTKIPECWASDLHARGLRVEISADLSLLLPFDQFAFSELKNNGKEQELRLVFATHEVSVRGNTLRRLETAMQRMELSFIAAIPNNMRLLIPEAQPGIIEIVVTQASTVEPGR